MLGEISTVPGPAFTVAPDPGRPAFTAGPGSDDPEHDESTPAETKIVTIVLPSCIILRL